MSSRVHHYPHYGSAAVPLNHETIDSIHDRLPRLEAFPGVVDEQSRLTSMAVKQTMEAFLQQVASRELSAKRVDSDPAQMKTALRAAMRI